MESTGSNISSFGRRVQFSGLTYGISQRKPHFNSNSYHVSEYSSRRNRPGGSFCFSCKMLRPCKCGTLGKEGSMSPRCFMTPPRIKYDYCNECHKIMPCDCSDTTFSQAAHKSNSILLSCDSCSKQDKTPKCKTCKCYLVAPRCPCGQPTYCCECEDVNPCDCGQYNRVRCLKCESFLMPPKCPCGKPTFCVQCEEITPCEECHSSADDRGLPKCFECTCSLVPPKCPCGKPMYCVQCEKISPCNCAKSKNQPKCLACSYVLTPPRCPCGRPTYCWHCEEISPCPKCAPCSESDSDDNPCEDTSSESEPDIQVCRKISSAVSCKERECKCKSRSRSIRSRSGSNKCKYYHIVYSSLGNLPKPKAGKTKFIVKKIKNSKKKKTSKNKLCCI